MRPLSDDQVKALNWLHRAADVKTDDIFAIPKKQRWVRPSSFNGLDTHLARPQLFAALEKRGLVASAEFGERPLGERERKWREYAITPAGVEALAQIKEA